MRKARVGPCHGLFLALLLSMGSQVLAEPSALPRPLYEAASRAVVRIEASDCGGEPASRISHGFVHQTPGEIITVLHGIAGCRSISVSLFGGPENTDVSHVAPAHLEKSWSKADLALIRLESLPTTGETWPQPLPLAPPPPPQPGTELYAIARMLDSKSPLERKLRVPNRSGRLENIVNDTARRLLEQRKSPALELDILNIEGQLMPGVSGAPILDAAGRVVAITDGGLEGGGPEINWAIPVRELDQLFVSKEAPPDPQAARATALLFSAGAEIQQTLSSGPASSITCGGQRLTKIRVMEAERLLEYSDDPQRGLQMLMQARTLGLGASLTRFDIYQDLESGAAVAVPEGISLQQRGRACVAQLAGEHIQLYLQVFDSSGPEDNALFLRDFEEFVEPWTQGTSGTIAMEDPTLSDAQLQDKGNGLLLQRKAFLFYDTQWLAYTGQPVMTHAMFRTVANRGTIIVSYVMLFTGGDQAEIFSNAMACLTGNCAQLSEQIVRLGQSYLAVQLTTFPP